MKALNAFKVVEVRLSNTKLGPVTYATLASAEGYSIQLRCLKTIPLHGEDILATFSMKSNLIVMFNRPRTVFIPDELLHYEKQKEEKVK